MSESKRKLHYVAEWRAFRKLSLRQLELRLEHEPGETLLSSTSLNRIEKGEQFLTPEIMYALAGAFDCGPEDLLIVNPLLEPEVIDLMAAIRKLRETKDPGKIVQATKIMQAVA